MGFRIGASALDRFLRVRCGRRGALAWSGRLTLAVSSLVFVLLASGTPASAASFGHARFARCGEGRCLELAGRPFFVYGAAFFYERLPRERWAGSLRELRALGINTLDLYVPWNWHERSDGDFDFSGRTNPRRDLRYLVSLIRRDGFAVIVRPGPVIRNEWRNGGYPAWLLKRPEYGMPPHDLLEGRYPPLATLQNAHSDDAAAGWLANATHRHYAARWLRHALAEFRPIADRVIGVALDDDQGAYLDNQTYPAPHLRAYLEWLAAIVHGATSPHELVFINTYEMRVPASSPVWTVGDWYQSRAYAIGAHDRADLDFSTALLGTRPGQPIVLGEFQAGWLQQPQDLFPRPAAPSNTLLAGVELLGLGARGIVNFPAQDTVYPAGWEVPFANPLYAWDAALRLDGTRSARYLPTARIGSFVRAFGESLAAAQVVRDAAIAYLGESLAPAGAQGPSPFALAAATIAAQRTCRRAGLSCALVDLAAPGSNLAGARVLVVPSLPGARMRPTVRARIASLRAGGIVVLAGSPSPHALRAALAQAGMQPAVRGLIGASLAQAKGQAVRAFVTWPNFSSERVRLREVDVAWDGARRVRLPALTIPPRGALLAALDVRLARLASGFPASAQIAFTDCAPAALGPAPESIVFRFDGSEEPCLIVAQLAGRTRRLAVPAALCGAVVVTPAALALRRSRAGSCAPQRSQAIRGIPIRPGLRLAGPRLARVLPGQARAFRADVYGDGEPAVILENARVRLVLEPRAGARAFVFEDLGSGASCFSTTGALRDGWLRSPPPSPTDKIAAYTHPFPAGTFNRPYRATILDSGRLARVRFAYDAPDVVPAGARYRRTVTLAPGANRFIVDERVQFPGGGRAAHQRAVRYDALALGGGARSLLLLTPEPRAFVARVSFALEGTAFGLYDARTRELVTIAWRRDDVEGATALEEDAQTIVRLVFAPAGSSRVVYSFSRAASLAAARADLALAARAVQGPLAARAKNLRVVGKWRNGLRDRLKSD